MSVNDSNFVFVLTILLTITSIISLGFFFYSAQNLFNAISGYSTSTGTANLTVESAVIINFTTSQVNWGSGRVNAGSSFATLNTNPTNNVTNGNWTLQTAGGLRLENLGNVNVTLNMSGTKTAAQMIGGTSPFYEWTFSTPEAGSCLNSTGGTYVFSDQDTVSTTSYTVCPRFRFIDSADVIRIDFELIIPSDSLTGALGDVITATATATS